MKSIKNHILISFMLLLTIANIFSQSWTNYKVGNLNIASNSNKVNSLTIDNLGVLWLGTVGGVWKFDGSNWAQYTESKELTGNVVYTSAIDNNNNIWFGTLGGVTKYDGVNWTKYTSLNTGWNLSTYIYSIAFDKNGNKWFGGSSGVSYFDGNVWTLYSQDNTYAAAVDFQNTKWFGCSASALKYNDLVWLKSTLHGFNNGVNCIKIDSHDNIWFGLSGGGITKYDGSTWTSYSTSNGLAGNTVYAIAFDAQGNKWFGTNNGVSKFDDTNWTTYKTEDGLASNYVSAIAIDGRNTKWFGTYGGGLSKFEDDVQKTFLITTQNNPTTGGTTTGNGTFTNGSIRTVTATANTGYIFTNWTENGSQVSTSSSYTFTVSGNRTLVANFTLQDGTCRTCPSYDLSILPNKSWQTQSSTIGLNGCMVFRIPVPSTPGYTYTFKTGCGDGATANFDTNLELFDSNCNLLTNNDDACSTLQSSITWISTYTSVAFIYVKVSGYTSTFGDFTLAFLRQDPVVNYTISTSSNPTTGGNTSGDGTVISGSSNTVTAIANTGYTFTNWTENGTVISTSANYTFTVSGNKTLVANFSASQIDLTTGLVAYYQFEGNANDLSGNGNNGTDIVGGVTFASGKTGQAAKFGGFSSPGHIRVPNSTSLQFTNGASFVYWVRLDDAAGMDGWGSLSSNGNQCALAKSHDMTGIYNNMGYTSQNKFYSYIASRDGGGVGSKVQGIAYNIGSWIQIAYSFSSTNSTLYVNGVKDTTTNTPLNFSTSNTQDLYIGKYNDNWYPLNGALDEFRIYNRALTDSEVQQIYAKMNTSIPEVESYGTKIYAIKNNAIIESANGWEVRVIDISGRTIMIKNSNSEKYEVNIPLSGLYLIRLSYKEKIFCEKLIIQ